MAVDVKVAPINQIRATPEMNGYQLRLWRAQRPGRFTYKNGQTRPGWTQDQAAEWEGREDGQLPLWLVKRLQDYPQSFSEVVDRLFDTDRGDIKKWGSVNPELAHELAPEVIEKKKGEAFDRQLQQDHAEAEAGLEPVPDDMEWY
jgi:hypothetical protein